LSSGGERKEEEKRGGRKGKERKKGGKKKDPRLPLFFSSFPAFSLDDLESAGRGGGLFSLEEKKKRALSRR